MSTGSNFQAPVTSTLTAEFIDSTGLITKGFCTGTPPTTANTFTHGAQLTRTDSGTGARSIYENTGTSAAPSWSLVNGVLQGAPTAQTVSATLTAAALVSGIITVNQGAGASSALQLPLAADLDTALPTYAAGDAFDFSVINISTVAAEDATITTNTGWTLVGNIDIASNAAATDKSAGRFRARKTAAATWTLYRIS